MGWTIPSSAGLSGSQSVGITVQTAQSVSAKTAKRFMEAPMWLVPASWIDRSPPIVADDRLAERL